MKISAVFCSKNDNPNNFTRVLLTLKNLINLYDEVVYVDYGSEGISLANQLRGLFPETGKLKVVEVPANFCKEVSPNNSNKFIEVYARNIGIRRASSEFIVSTNQDIICDMPSVLADDTMYTVRRYNYPINLVDGLLKVENPLNYLKQIKHNLTRQPMAVDENRNAIWDAGDIWSLVVSCGDYQIAHRRVWDEIRGFEESMVERCYADSNLMKKSEDHGFKINILDLDIFHLDHPINLSSNYNMNDRVNYINNFSKTKNSVDWGFAKNNFVEVNI
jgi:hypothetical protein